MTMCLTWLQSTLYKIEAGISSAAIEPEVVWDNASGILTTADAAR